MQTDPMVVVLRHLKRLCEFLRKMMFKKIFVTSFFHQIGTPLDSYINSAMPAVRCSHSNWHGFFVATFVFFEWRLDGDGVFMRMDSTSADSRVYP